MKPCIVVIFGNILMAGLFSPAQSHMIHYQVENKGVSARIFYPPEDPAAYAQYEIHGPGDKIPHQKGRTDKNGFVSFLPDRAGKWIVAIWDESDHGIHRKELEIQANENMFMESFKKPLFATYAMALAGIGLMGWIFGLWTWFRMKKTA